MMNNSQSNLSSSDKLKSLSERTMSLLVYSVSIIVVLLVAFMLYVPQAITIDIILAAVIVPLALFTLLRAWRSEFPLHKKIARWTLPIWLYVTITGVIVYLMISPYYTMGQ